MNLRNAKLFAAELCDDLPTIDLHGLYLNEVFSKLELFLYHHYQKHERAIKIIYGGGKGILREKVLDYLHTHPLVDTIQEQGGNCIVLFMS